MANTYSSLYYHIVFSTKRRRPFIDQEMEEEFWRYIGGVLKKHQIHPIQIGGIEDHIHNLVSAPARYSPSDIGQIIKVDSSKWAKKNIDRRFGWQDGYAGFTVSKSLLPKVQKYIANQREHHKKMTFEEEYMELLELHEVDIVDERFLFG